jgi:hypothetical protein
MRDIDRFLRMSVAREVIVSQVSEGSRGSFLDLAKGAACDRGRPYRDESFYGWWVGSQARPISAPKTKMIEA